MAKNVLLLGGTGAIGTHIANILHNNRDYNVTITSRHYHKSYDNIRFIEGNAQEEMFMRELLGNHKFDAIIDFMIYPTESFKTKVDFLLNSCDQYIFLSSSRVYSNENSIITEDTPRLLDVCKDKDYLLTDEYALRKAREEDILFKSGKSNFTIIRPYITYSEIRLQLGVLEKERWLYRALQGRTIVVSKDVLERTTTLTYGYDVARGITALIGNPKAYGEVFHITTAEFHKWSEILEVYTNVLENFLDHKPKVLVLDEFPYQHKNRPFYQLLYDRHFDRVFDNSKISKFIDTSTFNPTLEGLRECLETFLQKQKFREIIWRWEAGYDRLTREHARWNEIPNNTRKLKYCIQRYILPKTYF
jgi:nucleoside-diphosphate-sugar epimerase